jgi:hypothetical protein
MDEIVSDIGRCLFKLFSALGGEQTFIGIFGDGIDRDGRLHWGPFRSAGWLVIVLVALTLLDMLTDKKKD